MAAPVPRMEWVNDQLGRVPVKSWCAAPDAKALAQAANLAAHPAIFRHIALMPDCHVGYGMPIGGVAACAAAVIPNAVGVDIGCGMRAVRTDVPGAALAAARIGAILAAVRRHVPVGEGRAHAVAQDWDGFERVAERPGGVDAQGWALARRNLGTLGGGNHFIELQAGADGRLWLMIHSGSRNLGLRIAEHYHRCALRLNERQGVTLPDPELAYLPLDTPEARDYLRDMALALAYARENRRRIMAALCAAVAAALPAAAFEPDLDIHHNYAARETHFGREVWVHRKGATAASAGALGIVPGSMGTPSFIVRGLGHPESFQSCAHGAGRRMGRKEACRTLDPAACDRAMRGIVFDGWQPLRGFGARGRRAAGLFDLEEAPPAYKDIHAVMRAQRDLVEPVVELRPLGVVKG